MSAKKIIAWIVYVILIVIADRICKTVASTSVDFALLLSFIEGCLAVAYVHCVLFDGEF